MNNLIERIRIWAEDLSDTQKRLISAGLLLLGALIIGFLIYWLFFRSLLPTNNEGTVNVNGVLVNVGGLPDVLFGNNNRNTVNGNQNTALPGTVANGGITVSEVIYDGDAEQPTLAGDGKTVQYYDPDTGKFYKVDVNGNVVELDSNAFPGVENVTWSNDTNKAVLELADGNKLLYDFQQKRQYGLNKDMNSFDFSPSDTQISFEYTPVNEEDRWLGVANVDGSGALGIEPLGQNADLLNAQWSPSGQMLGMVSEYIDADRKSVIPIGLHDENFKQFIVNGRGFDYRWTPDGRRMIYQVYSQASNYNPTLNIVDAYGDNVGQNNRSLNLATSVDKCSFNGSGDHLYCAVPVNPPSGGGIAPDKLNNVAHDIYMVNLSSGTVQKVATPTDSTGGGLTAPKQVMVSSDEAILYYSENTTGKIRRILLK